VTLCVFVGPTLHPDEVAAACDAVCLPPAAQGDVYRAARLRPRAIGIIDGYFGGAPSVWHKEILWALSEGIEVFGSASMGALRAAELHSFGMQGVGRIFEAYRDGLLEDDDEVALVHGPAETGFVAASEPMVTIRATLARAEAEGVLRPSSRRVLEEVGKSLFFSRRSWPALLEAAGERGLSPAGRAAFGLWLPGGRVDQKRLDALAMLAAMRQSTPAAVSPGPQFRFQRTHFWEEMTGGPMGDPVAGDAAGSADERILEELRLEGPAAYGEVKAAALLRWLAASEADRQGLPQSASASRLTLHRLREALGLFTRAELDAWLLRNHLEAAAFERLIQEQARAEAVTAALGATIHRPLLDELRLRGAYERLAERARKKHRAERGASDAVVLRTAAGPADSRRRRGVRARPRLR
jgi:hypothetical protein